MNKLKKIATILILVVVAVTVFRGVFRLISSRSRVDEARAKLEEVKKQQTELEAKLEEVSSDYYKEEQLRDKLGLVKQGETVIVLPSEDVLRRLSPRILEEAEENETIPNWKKWAKLFLDI